MTAAAVTPLREPSPTPACVAPFNEAAEQALLGALLVDNAPFGEVSRIVKAGDFGRAVHGRIYAAIAKLIDAGRPADHATLKSVFDRDEALAPIGGGKYLLDLARSAVTISNAPHYAAAIADCSCRRRLMAMAEDLAEEASQVDLDKPADDIAARFREQFDEIARGLNGKTPAFRFPVVDAAALSLNRRGAYLVKDILPAQGLVVIWGPPKCGKSFWVLDLAFHVALGWQYRGHRVKQGLALYIGCEGEFAVPARVEAFRQAKIRGAIDPDKFKLILTRLNLVADADRLILDIAAQLGDRTPAIIVIDTVNRSLVGSESSDEDMGNYVKSADKLRERFQCAVALVHHSGYDASHPRGHTSLGGAADAQIAVKKDDGLISTAVEFLKDGPEGTETASRFKVIDNLDFDEDGEPISSCVLEEAGPVPASQKGKAKQKLPSPLALKFWEAFNNAGAACAEPRHAAGDRPAITEDQWLAELVRRGLIEPAPQKDADKASSRGARNRRDALFSKYRRELISLNWLACNGKVLWSVKEPKS